MTEEMEDNFIWNAQLYLVSSALTNSLSNPMPDPSLNYKQIIGISLGVSAILLIFLTFWYRNCFKKPQDTEIRYSHASTIMDDQSYTLHSDSTLSTIP
jgi:hypothetical protein